jgi:hypothetical protein
MSVTALKTGAGVPAYRYNRGVSYEEFEVRVRRHRTSDLLPAIARVAIELEERGVRPEDERLLLPWGLMAAVKESVRAGNEHRSGGVSLRDVQEICGAFNALADPLLDHEREPELGALHSFFVRVAYEQFFPTSCRCSRNSPGPTLCS